MKQLFCSLLLYSLIAFNSFSQENSEWTPYFSDDFIQVDIREENCKDTINGLNTNYVFIRLTNKLAVKLSVTYDKELIYNNKVSEIPEDRSFFLLSPRQVIEGTCSTLNYKSLYIFQSQTGGKNKNVLTSYSLKNFITTPRID